MSLTVWETVHAEMGSQGRAGEHTAQRVLEVLDSQPAARDSAWSVLRDMLATILKKILIPSWFLSTPKCPPTMFQSQLLCIPDRYG